ncbi:conserved Plasmodium protein, unknown function [Plasmodium gallinaceum]|uniref:RNA-binding protein n=1 Tax=Plasmodium gallinaceum TaxID=5849 RepID=A0A1J1GSF7_PLAGA|nr:conserved Plasmodium protein, unknown function [Plasmodium gallinaceum]CRG95417.1 conserved Plasmodium protein, unknown function [Plasmodium gallinaceum]
MNQILNSNATIICKNIPIDINHGPLLGEGIYFGKKKSGMFFIKYVHFKDAIKAYESLKNNKICEHDFKLSFSKNDEIKYKALKGNKKAIIELKNIYNKNEESKTNNDISIDIINELNEQNNELLKKKKKEKEIEKKKDKSFILNLLTKTDEIQINEQDIKEELKNYINLNCLCSYDFDENNKYDNYLTPIFPN